MRGVILAWLFVTATTVEGRSRDHVIRNVDDTFDYDVTFISLSMPPVWRPPSMKSVQPSVPPPSPKGIAVPTTNSPSSSTSSGGSINSAAPVSIPTQDERPGAVPPISVVDTSAPVAPPSPAPFDSHGPTLISSPAPSSKAISAYPSSKAISAYPTGSPISSPSPSSIAIPTFSSPISSPAPSSKAIPTYSSPISSSAPSSTSVPTYSSPVSGLKTLNPSEYSTDLTVVTGKPSSVPIAPPTSIPSTFGSDLTTGTSTPNAPTNTDDDWAAQCQSSSGDYGSLVGESSAVISYAYEIETKFLSQTNLSTIVLPALETSFTNVLLPIFFDECTVTVTTINSTQRRNLLASDEPLEGFSAFPRDIPVHGIQCVSSPIQDQSCWVVLGEMTTYYHDHSTDHGRALLARDKVEQETIRKALQQSMEKGVFDSGVHEAIVRVSYVDLAYLDTAAEDYMVDDDEIHNDAITNQTRTSERVESPSPVVLGLVVAAAVSTFIVGLLVYYRRQHQRRFFRDVDDPSHEDSEESDTDTPSSQMVQVAMFTFDKNHTIKHNTNNLDEGDDDCEDRDGEGVDVGLVKTATSSSSSTAAVVNGIGANRSSSSLDDDALSVYLEGNDATDTESITHLLVPCPMPVPESNRSSRADEN